MKAGADTAGQNKGIGGTLPAEIINEDVKKRTVCLDLFKNDLL